MLKFQLIIILQICFLIVIFYLSSFTTAIEIATNHHHNHRNDFSYFDEIDCLSELPITNLLKIKRSVDELMTCSPQDKIIQFNSVNSSSANSDQSIILNRQRVDILASTVNTNKNDTRKYKIKNSIISEALPLISATDQIESRTYYYPDAMDEKPTKLQTVFQLSITALTFLAFGGYLLCLIVQAIKSKGTTYFHPVTSTMSTNTLTGLKRIKIYRRSRRWISKGRRRKRNTSSGNPNITTTPSSLLSSSSSSSTSSDTIMQQWTLATPSPDELYKVLESIAEGYVKIVQFQ